MPSFSGRIRWELEENELARSLERARREGIHVYDLTSSNPTRAGLSYPESEILRSLQNPELLQYEPEPRSALPARKAIAGYYAERSARIEPADLFLTASTSEAYSFLFKLLCDPGEEILVPRPSYPLFEFLAALDSVEPVHYPLRFDGTWHLDFPALEGAISEKTRAVVAVHPNNPTGSYLLALERNRLLEICARRGIALIVDEVFLDFALSTTAEVVSFAGSRTGLVFVLSGLSKLAGLPQMKLGWIAISGEKPRKEEAALRLEHIADAYLSVGAPVSVAAPSLIRLAPSTRGLISERTKRNFDSLAKQAASESSVTLLPAQGGWYATLRLPAVRSSEEWALALLASDSVYVHPGSFFGFEGEAFLVLSLLTPGDVFDEGVRRILRRVAR